MVNLYRYLQKLGFYPVFLTNQFKILFVASLLATLIYLLPIPGGTAETLRLQVSQAIPNSQAWASINVQAAVPLTQQGNQILLNGRSLAAVWSQKQQRIGISDTALIQSFGIDLLDTSDAARQPVQWFSQPTLEPFVVSTWLTRQYRYLDITDLAQRQGWQVRAANSTLQISTPPSKITGIRQGRQSWGDRIVIDLERATPWQLSQQGGEVVIAVDAQIEPTLVQSFTAVPGDRLTALKVETSGSQTLIRVGSNDLRPQVWTLPHPNRLVIDIRPDVARARNIAWAPGIRWQSQTVRIGNAQFPIESLVIDPRQPGVSLKPIWANPETAIGTAPLSTIAQRWQAVAAINGGFFNRNNQLPLGAIRQDQRWLSGPILNRGAIAWNDAGEVAIGRLSLQDSILTANNQRFPLLSLNSGYVQAGIARYTADWGAYTPILDREVLITVQDDRVISQTSSGAAGQNPVPIPANGYLLVVRSNSAAVTALAVGTVIRHEPTLTPTEFSQFPQILGAGPLLIQNRQIVLNAQSEQFSDGFIRQAAVRSAVGTLADGNLLLVTVQNRLGGSGPTLEETAQVMQRLGTVNALNLDGGSSTTLYLGGQLLNRSPQTAARVHNGLGVFIQPP